MLTCDLALVLGVAGGRRCCVQQWRAICVGGERVCARTSDLRAFLLRCLACAHVCCGWNLPAPVLSSQSWCASSACCETGTDQPSGASRNADRWPWSAVDVAPGGFSANPISARVSLTVQRSELSTCIPAGQLWSAGAKTTRPGGVGAEVMTGGQWSLSTGSLAELGHAAEVRATAYCRELNVNFGRHRGPV